MYELRLALTKQTQLSSQYQTTAADGGVDEQRIRASLTLGLTRIRTLGPSVFNVNAN